MRGEIDFRESFTRRVALLRGLNVEVMEEIAQNLPITEGLERLMTILKRVGYKTAILSGGFTYFGNFLRRRYGFDYVYANELEIEDGRLTGRTTGEIVDGGRKARPASAALPVRGHQHRPVDRRGGRGQRPADAQYRRSGHRFSRQTQSQGHGQPVHLNDRAGRHPLFPRSQRLLDRITAPASAMLRLRFVLVALSLTSCYDSFDSPHGRSGRRRRPTRRSPTCAPVITGRP